MKLEQSSRIRFFAASLFVGLLGVLFYGQSAIAAQAITVYKTPT